MSYRRVSQIQIEFWLGKDFSELDVLIFGKGMYIWNEKETKDNGKNPGKGKLVACGTDAEGAFKRLHIFLRKKILLLTSTY